jgi:adhesin transport system membrane fusion protein
MMINPAMTMRRLRSLDGAQAVIVACFAAVTLFILWAALARVDEVTRGQGRVIPSSKMQMVQSAEPATIKDILVRSGQTVRKGQLLVRLDDAILLGAGADRG